MRRPRSGDNDWVIGDDVVGIYQRRMSPSEQQWCRKRDIIVGIKGTEYGILNLTGGCKQTAQT